VIGGNLFKLRDALSSPEKHETLAPHYPVDVRDEMQNTPLHEAAAYNQVEAIAILVAAGADLNARDIHGDRPLHKAVSYGCKEAVDQLVKFGADVRAQNNAGKTAF